MNINRQSFASILSLLFLPAFAVHAAPPAGGIAINCDHRYISQADAARVLHTDNFSQTYAKRQSLYTNVARTCQKGVDEVLLLAREPRRDLRTLASR